MLKALITIVIIIAAGIGIGSTATHLVKHDSDKQVLSTESKQAAQENSQVAQPQIAQPGIPTSVKIPKIAIDTEIESVANDAEGRMDVPKKNSNTAWYRPGYKPGQVGNAVLAGHYDKVDGSPSVFYNLAKLEKGDKIYITDDKGKQQTFEVVKTQKFPDADFPIQQVFGSSTEPMLNLITCHGTWDAKAKNYSERYVVYSQLVK